MLLPPGHRRSFLDRVGGAYLAGTCSGALLTAVGAWVLSGLTEPLTRGIRLTLLVAGAALIWLAKQGPLSEILRLPEARRQIPSQVFGGGLVRGAYRFGLELGTGLRTYVPSAAPYVLLLAVLVGRFTLATALSAGLGFGVGRALPLLLALSAPARLQFTRDFLRGIEELAPATAAVVVLGGALALV